ncbi:hypothetical protein DY000_02020693 [Brassica cretica]|uniref:Reverse transcriptase zinc-binding domain-containing protein n=1 Tax=Brassica cretica TaxID=69181 RepID=A0ABQ7E5S6_BRACR|nr:hypothetical protein DY000_02020693 [Brassica cretica]
MFNTIYINVGNLFIIRRCRDRQIQSLVAEIQGLQLKLTDGRDAVLWTRGIGDYGTTFVSTETWNQISQQTEKVLWSKTVWFPQGVPRFGFIIWLAIRDRLSTGHRSSVWGQPQHCLYCGEPDETRDHLFFACPYTFTLWLKMVGNLLGTDPDPDWNTTLSTMMTRPYDRLTFILLRLVLQATIYYLWREPNERKHHTSSKTVDQLAKMINKTVRNRITSTNYSTNPRLDGLMQ